MAWRSARSRVFVGLDAQHMVWQQHGAPPNAVPHAPQADGVDTLKHHLKAHAQVDVIVGNDVAVHWVQTPPAAVQSLDELRQVAAARCARLFGGLPTEWWVAGDWSANHPFVCAGLPMYRVGPVLHALNEVGAQARWHTAWGLLCQTRARTFPADGWSAMRSFSRVVLWCCQHGHVSALASLPIDSDADPDAAQALVSQHQRMETLRDLAHLPGPVHWAHMQDLPDAPARSEAHAALALVPLLLPGSLP